MATVKPGDAGAEVATEIPIADQLHIFGRIYPTSCRDQRVADSYSRAFSIATAA